MKLAMKPVQVWLHWTVWLFALVCADLDEEAIAVFTELSELEMEDVCAATALDQLARFKGLQTPYRTDEDLDLHKIVTLTAIELSDQNSYEFSTELQRKLDLLAKPGDLALERDSWDKFISFVEDAKQNITSHKIDCEFNDQSKCSLADINKVLSNTSNVTILRNAFDSWNANGTPWNLDKLFNNINLINTASNENGLATAAEYWESLCEFPNGYDKAYELWDQIQPLYEKLHEFIGKRISVYNTELEENITEIIPSYLLGSLDGLDWSINPDNLLPHPYVYRKISDSLTTQDLSGKHLYWLAQNLTTNLGLGSASEIFWSESLFNGTCPSQIVDFCQSGNSIIISCNESNWHSLVDAYETFMKVIHNKLAADEDLHNSFLLTHASRYSGVYEAVPYLPLLFIMKSQHLNDFGIIDYADYSKGHNNSNINNYLTMLLLNALHVLPRLPYYLAVDTWRLELLENQLDEGFSNEDKINLWKNIRRKYTKVDSYDYEFYHDQYVLENKPYLAKFFGGILQFQLFAELIGEVPENVDIEKYQINDKKLSDILRSGLLQEWPDLLMNLFYIYDIEVEPLLTHYEPLVKYLDDFSEAPQEVVVLTTSTEKSTTSTTKLTSQNVPALNTVENIRTYISAQDVNESVSAIEKSSAPWIIMVVVGIVLLLVVIYIIDKRRKQNKRMLRRNVSRA